MTSIIALIAATSIGIAADDGHHHAHAAATAAAIQQNAQPATTRTDLGDRLYAIMGRGGNILVSTGPDGAFVIDDQFADIAAENLQLIDEVSDTPVVFVLNTHFHGDHTGGNEAFVNAGATVIAHDNVRARLAEQAESGDVANSALPVITFSEAATFHWNDKDIHVVHVPSAHTDGDAIVYFRNANLIHTGDTLFAGRYPFIDVASGGSVDGMISALETVADLSNSSTTVVPGHGPVSGKSDVLAAIDLLKNSRNLVREQMMMGKSREDVIAANPLSDMNEEYAWEFINGDRMTGQLFDDLMAQDTEAKAAVEAGPQEEVEPVAEPAPEAEPVEDAADTQEPEDEASDGMSDAASVVRRMTNGGAAKDQENDSDAQ